MRNGNETEPANFAGDFHLNGNSQAITAFEDRWENYNGRVVSGAALGMETTRGNPPDRQVLLLDPRILCRHGESGCIYNHPMPTVTWSTAFCWPEPDNGN